MRADTLYLTVRCLSQVPGFEKYASQYAFPLPQKGAGRSCLSCPPQLPCGTIATFFNIASHLPTKYLPICRPHSPKTPSTMDTLTRNLSAMPTGSSSHIARTSSPATAPRLPQTCIRTSNTHIINTNNNLRTSNLLYNNIRNIQCWAIHSRVLVPCIRA